MTTTPDNEENRVEVNASSLEDSRRRRQELAERRTRLQNLHFVTSLLIASMLVLVPISYLRVPRTPTPSRLLALPIIAIFLLLLWKSILLGVGVISATLYLVLHVAATLQAQVVTAILGGTGALFTNVIAAIYLIPPPPTILLPFTESSSRRTDYCSPICSRPESKIPASVLTHLPIWRSAWPACHPRQVPN
jgi:hypothetical protein